MQIQRPTVGLITVLLLGAVLGIQQFREAAEKPRSSLAVSDMAFQLSRAPAAVAVSVELAGNAGATAPSVAVSYRQGLLSVDARRTVLRDALIAVTQATGVTFAADDDTGQAVTVAVGPAPLQQAIADLMHRVGYGHVLIGDDHRTQGSGPVQVFMLRPAGGVHSPQTSRSTSTVSALAEPGRGQVNEGRPVVMDAATVLQHRVFEQIMEACKQQECDAS